MVVLNIKSVGKKKIVGWKSYYETNQFHQLFSNTFLIYCWSIQKLSWSSWLSWLSWLSLSWSRSIKVKSCRWSSHWWIQMSISSIESWVSLSWSQSIKVLSCRRSLVESLMNLKSISLVYSRVNLSWSQSIKIKSCIAVKSSINLYIYSWSSFLWINIMHIAQS